jgi:hypothetical protein
MEDDAVVLARSIVDGMVYELCVQKSDVAIDRCEPYVRVQTVETVTAAGGET